MMMRKKVYSHYLPSMYIQHQNVYRNVDNFIEAIQISYIIYSERIFLFEIFLEKCVRFIFRGLRFPQINILPSLVRCSLFSQKKKTIIYFSKRVFEEKRNLFLKNFAKYIDAEETYSFLRAL